MRSRCEYPAAVRAAILVAGGVSCVFADAGAQSISPERLTPGAPLTRELARDRSHLYEIGLAPGQFVTVVITKAVLAPVVAITDPAGRSLVDTSAKEISVVVETAGRHLIRIRADDTTGPPGLYEIVVDVRQAGAAEHARIRRSIAHRRPDAARKVPGRGAS